MAALTVFYPDVLVWARTAPDPLVNQALVRSAREFCRRTLVWRQWLACVKSVSPVYEYTPTLPSGSEALQLEQVTLDGRTIEIATMWQPELDFEGDADDLEQLSVTRTLVTFTLTGAEQTGTVKAFLALQPTRASTTLPDLLASRYLEAICDGAISYLLRLPKTTFENQAQANEARVRFMTAVGEAGHDTFKGLTAARPRSRINWC